VYNPRPLWPGGIGPEFGEGLRLTGGEARGRRIKGPRGLDIRPTADRVREALFDILGPRVGGRVFLDAYAGTGAVGVEALSRGARRVVFLEGDRRAIRLIEENLKIGPWSGAVEVIQGDVPRSLERLARRTECFDFVFLDPPYDHPSLTRALTSAGRLLAEGGVLVVEHRSTLRIEALGLSLRPARSYKYGDTSLTLLLAPGDSGAG
jgi:16S rRNA (guanine966-N2)-methyltransferase